MTCDDGIVKICDVVNVSEPGMKPNRIQCNQYINRRKTGFCQICI